MKRPASAARTFAVSLLAAVALGALSLLAPPALAEESATPGPAVETKTPTPTATPTPTPSPTPTPTSTSSTTPTSTPPQSPAPATSAPARPSEPAKPSPSHAVVKPRPKPSPTPTQIPFQPGESVPLPAGSDKGPIGPPAQAAPNVGTLHAGLFLSWASWMLFAIGVLALAAGVAGLVVARQRRSGAGE